MSNRGRDILGGGGRKYGPHSSQGCIPYLPSHGNDLAQAMGIGSSSWEEDKLPHPLIIQTESSMSTESEGNSTEYERFQAQFGKGPQNGGQNAEKRSKDQQSTDTLYKMIASEATTLQSVDSSGDTSA